MHTFSPTSFWSLMEYTLQPKYDKLASNLLLLSMLIVYTIDWCIRLDKVDIDATVLPQSIALLGAVAVLKIFHAYSIRQGKKWARVVLAVLFILNFWPLIADRNVIFKVADYYKGVKYALTQAIQAVALFLVFRYKFTKGIRE